MNGNSNLTASGTPRTPGRSIVSPQSTPRALTQKQIQIQQRQTWYKELSHSLTELAKSPFLTTDRPDNTDVQAFMALLDKLVSINKSIPKPMHDSIKQGLGSVCSMLDRLNKLGVVSTLSLKQSLGGLDASLRENTAAIKTHLIAELSDTSNPEGAANAILSNSQSLSAWKSASPALKTMIARRDELQSQIRGTKDTLDRLAHKEQEISELRSQVKALAAELTTTISETETMKRMQALTIKK